MRGNIPYYGASGIVDYVNAYLFDEDLILLGEDGENILSRVVPLAFKITGKSWVNNHAHVLRPKASFDIDFLTAYLESLDYAGLNSGTAQPKLNKQSCSTIRVVKPPLVEQRRIAATLRDTDDLIAKLEQMIAKKQAIKQGLMQQLLTRRTRLPAFHEEWVTAPLKEFLPLQRGFDLPASQVRPGPYPVVYSNGVARHHAQAMVRGPGVVTGRSGTIGKVHYIDEDYWPHNTSLWVTSFARVEPLFAYYFLSYLGLERFASGSGVPTFNRNDAHLFPITLPTDRGEQAAIAAILRDADAELSAFTKRLAKAREVKRGMLQQLLTGRTRLPVPVMESAA
ncbi:restriction endonuclease subunit S [Streptomyces sp. SID4946]|nr:restriction endonuclease subunit S [Streptomyces sp. SID4946]SCF66683.1 type I restriction enzyme, S subunit [Streptomyces sp. LamerLS-31b]SCF72825.1 type I restriction enzyme, S subunit [Streptomyces sp. DconLS]